MAMDNIDIDVREIFATIYKRLWIILVIPVITGIIAAFLSTYYMKPVYQASTLIMINDTQRIQGTVYSLSEVDRDLKLVETYTVIIKSPRIMELVKERVGFPTTAGALNGQVAVSRVKNSQVFSVTVKDGSLEKAVKIANTVAEVFQDEIVTIMQVDNVQILAKAKEEENLAPVEPNPTMNIVVAIILGLGTGLGITFLIELFDKYLHTERDVEKILGLSVLGKIPYITPQVKDNKHALRGKSNRHTVLHSLASYSGISTGQQLRGSKWRRMFLHLFRHFVTFTDSWAVTSEAYRTLRTNIQFTHWGQDFQTLAVTNSGPDKGNSTTIANLAIILALTGKKVLLIDADMRYPCTHEFFETQNNSGLSELLNGEKKLDEIVQNTMVNGLDLLTAGTLPPNPSELLIYGDMPAHLEHFRRLYDYILVDTPPIVLVTDAQVLVSKMDGVLLVVQSGKTTKTMGQRAKQLLTKVDAKILGVVLREKKKRRQVSYH